MTAQDVAFTPSTLAEQQHIVAVLHCAEALAKDYREVVCVLSDLTYVRESKLQKTQRPFVVERIDPLMF